MQNVKISVIIPIYNVENYIRQCIESVLNQNYENTEIILVDDGSPDGCSIICDEYGSDFPNVKVIHKENGGLSDARNHGIKHATGDYVLFLDGDDYWSDSSALTMLVNRIEKTKAEVLSFSFVKFFEDTKEKIPYFKDIPSMPSDYTSKAEQCHYISKNHLYLSSACTKMIKRDLLSEDLFFEKGVYSEDVEWSAKLLVKAESMDFICENFYLYRQRRNSITHSINDKNCSDLCKHILACMKLHENEDGVEKDALAGYAAYQYGTFFIVQAQAQHWQERWIEELRRYDNILKYHFGNKKIYVLYIACKILGYKNTCRLVRFLYSLKKQRK